MASEHVERLTELIGQAKPKHPRGKTIEVKHFFGGAAAFLDGRIFMSLTKVGVGLKLPEADRDRLFRSRQAKPLRYFPKAPVKRQYALFPGSLLDDSKLAKTWIERSITFVTSNASEKRGDTNTSSKQDST